MDDFSQTDPFDFSIEADPDWTEFHLDRNVDARSRIIESYLPFTRMMAAKTYAKRTCSELEFQDYLQYATIGLVEAVDRFDPNRGVKFETFSATRITGAILNGIDSLSEKQQQVGARRRAIAARV
ncbi:MAG TPA: sigma factor, partial [Burkholderiaceae bacterium]|nr:sigma factor [Burkholderiaceae bacterium]